MWAQLCAEADIRPLTLHAARHTSVTHMRSRGVPDQITAAWHGHDETIMRKVYPHATEEDLRAAHDQNVTRQRG